MSLLAVRRRLAAIRQPLTDIEVGLQGSLDDDAVRIWPDHLPAVSGGSTR
jgi:hypothetical protein